MTQLRNFRDSISNYFDGVLRGIGKRGSSFSDIDAVSHDRDTHRFLVQEFKRENDPINPGQHWMLRDLAAIPRHFTVWHIVKRDDGQIGFADYGDELRVIGVDEYRARFAAWWAERPFAELSQEKPGPTVPTRPVTADEIRWGR